jgi:hypothetical protein
MPPEIQSYSGFAAMGETAVGGLDPSEHQGAVSPDVPGAEPTPSEESIPPRGSGYTGEDVGATSPGSGTSISGAGGRPGPGGTMTEGIWSQSRPNSKAKEPPSETSTAR